MKLKDMLRHLPITKYAIGIALVIIAFGATHSMYVLFAFWGGMIAYSSYDKMSEENSSVVRCTCNSCNGGHASWCDIKE